MKARLLVFHHILDIPPRPNQLDSVEFPQRCQVKVRRVWKIRFKDYFGGNRNADCGAEEDGRRKIEPFEEPLTKLSRLAMELDDSR